MSHFEARCVVLGAKDSGKSTLIQQLCLPNSNSVDIMNQDNQLVRWHIREGPGNLSNTNAYQRLLESHVLALITIDLSSLRNPIADFQMWYNTVSCSNTTVPATSIIVIGTKMHSMFTSNYEVLRQHIFSNHPELTFIAVSAVYDTNINHIRDALRVVFDTKILPLLNQEKLANDQYRRQGIHLGNLHQQQPAFKQYEQIIQEEINRPTVHSSVNTQTTESNSYLCNSCQLM
jgi:GTPase SAR1 family protein